MATATLPKIESPRAARKGTPWPKKGRGIQAASVENYAAGGTMKFGGGSIQQEIAAYLATLEPGEREANLSGLQGFLAGNQVAPEWYSAVGDFKDPNKGGPSKIYQMAQALKAQGARRFDKGGKQTLSEPSAVVGIKSGKIYATIDENGAKDPETITVKNPGKKMAAPKWAKLIPGSTPLAGGGSVSLVSSTGTTSGAYGGTSTTDRTALTAAQKAANAASQQYLNQQSLANAASTQEAFNIQQASKNTADLGATAAARSMRNASNYRYGAFGLDVPEEIVAGPNEAGALLPGVRTKIESQQDIVTRQADEHQQMRGFGLETARINAGTAGLKASNAGIDYADANSRRTSSSSGGGGYTVDPAALATQQRAQGERVRQAGEAATRTRLAREASMQARPSGGSVGTNVGSYLASDGSGGQYAATSAGESEIASTPGTPQYLAASAQAAGNKVMSDPETGRPAYYKDLVTKYGGPEGLAIASARAAIVEDPITGEPTTRAALNEKYGGAAGIARARTENAAKDPVYTRSDGVRVDPRTNAEYRNGQWVIPSTGAVNQPGTMDWVVTDKTDGSVAIFHVVDERQGQGYWTDKDGNRIPAPGTGPVTYAR